MGSVSKPWEKKQREPTSHVMYPPNSAQVWNDQKSGSSFDAARFIWAAAASAAALLLPPRTVEFCKRATAASLSTASPTLPSSMTRHIPDMLQHACWHCTSLSWGSKTATPPPAKATRFAGTVYLRSVSARAAETLSEQSSGGEHVTSQGSGRRGRPGVGGQQRQT